MTIIWAALGLDVADVLYRLAKSLGSGSEGASVFFRSEFGNLSTLVLLACIVYLIKNESFSKAA
ncbi:MAG: hypothetical protein IPF72_19615 [Chitinophagaceae bacterium]|nr:hypothetical protein [Chitinophagaceae bacterium]